MRTVVRRAVGQGKAGLTNVYFALQSEINPPDEKE